MARHTVRVASYVILVKDNNAFFMRRKNTGWRDGEYNLPSGHIEEGETPSEAAIRELKEEAGVDVSPEDLKFALVMHRKPDNAKDFEYVDFFYSASAWKGEPRIMEDDKCDEVGWFHMQDLPENIIPYLRDAIIALRDGVAYLER